MKTGWSTLLVFVLAGGLLAGCGRSEDQSDSNPEKLRFGLLVAQETEQTYERLDVLTKYFAKQLGREVEFLQITTPSAMIEAMRARKIEVAGGTGAFTYLVASKVIGAEAIATTTAADGNVRYYKSCLITSPNSGLRSIDDVIKNAGNITLSWAYPTSTSGHLVPRYYLQKRGIKPQDFKEVFTSTDHTATLFSVASGKVDVAAIMYATLDRFMKTGKVKPGAVRVIWESEPIAPGPIFVRKDLDPALKKQIQLAYTNVAKADPDAMEALQSQFTYSMSYIPVTDSLYQSLRQMANQIEGLTLKEE
ncbi:phosphate/phosphite/phosphonate ABC transporter substrate-binding protein [Fibrisoma limi]|nr:phosphate/phosphite/phosphonate ABC transporter substrate-binding protein [Fibrisoma limi]